ncbi:hypothetical protein PC9H_010302 [Pleurotus ostreatus]|uniref:Rab-GAP TBC domain-containing protein n=1 Tax=Pleurotus ostreatus TaxID=5322 RepID=A0A8H7DSX2_PLEOS|nr:uncharacterized protein PC9H_010302 [Pleurotus ostreatus]KAF7424991.1 hypothetical protein PC9H_010302 [Pleurotus ostreatus]
MALHRKPHQGPETVSGDVTISEEEFDSISKRNVEKWISAHIIPESPITLESKTYPTILHRKTVSFTALPKSDPKAAEWTRVLVNGDVHIIGMKELSLPNLWRKQSRQDDASSIAASSIDNEYETAQAEGMDFELVRPSFSHLHSARTSEDSSFVKDGGQRELRWIALMSSVPASQARKNKKVKKLLVEGVPSSVRYLVRIHLTDGKAKNVPKVYEQLVKRGHVPSYKEIERDVQAYIRENSQPPTMRESMMSLLEAYLTMVPDVQYSRGLTLIVGNIPLLAPEEDRFWTFVFPDGLVSSALFLLEQFTDGG